MLNVQEKIWQLHRSETGIPVAVDANLAAIIADWDHALQCSGFDSVLVGVTATAAGACTVGVKMVFYDGTTDAWSSSETVLANNEFVELNCFVSEAYVMISAVTGAPTQVDLKVMGAARSRWTR
jgi:hypothetical protein